MALTTRKLDDFFRGFLDIDGFAGMDSSMNGIQVDNDGSELKKIAFAVDACQEVFKRAIDAGAGLIFVHHGLFWGKPLRIDGGHRERVKLLLENNVALYAVHLPLDQHPTMGNNVLLMEMLGVKQPQPFGMYHGRHIGYKGELSTPLTVDEVVKKISYKDRPPLGVYPFGKKESCTCAVICGGAAYEAIQAIEEGVDLYVSGETNHTVYHHAMEARLNIIAGGHYSTEVWGVRRMMEECVNQIPGLDCEFIDVPTGL